MARTLDPGRYGRCFSVLLRVEQRLGDIEDVVRPVLHRPRAQRACFGERPAGEDRVDPARWDLFAAVERTEERAGDRGVGIGVAAASDRLDERLLEIELVQAEKGVTKEDMIQVLHEQEAGNK